MDLKDHKLPTFKKENLNQKLFPLEIKKGKLIKMIMLKEQKVNGLNNLIG